MKAKLPLILILISIFSCEEVVTISFSEMNKEYNENALIEINIPKAEGSSDIAMKINTKIENHIANMLNFGEDNSDTLSVSSAISKFDDEYTEFKSDFEESALVWEATFDGEVTYHSSEVITVAINSYLNTGGAHGTVNVTLLNFEASTGNSLTIDKIIADTTQFKKLAEKHFKTITQTDKKSSYDDYFFGEAFHLPANIGFNDEGVLLFYNVYEIASYANGITEFTIPYEEVEEFLQTF